MTDSFDDIKFNVTIKWDDKTTYHENVTSKTPLYHTAPKELSDEEIMEIAKKSGQGNPFHIPPEFIKQFARAILKKASEK